MNFYLTVIGQPRTKYGIAVTSSYYANNFHWYVWILESHNFSAAKGGSGQLRMSIEIKFFVVTRIKKLLLVKNPIKWIAHVNLRCNSKNVT